MKQTDFQSLILRIVEQAMQLKDMFTDQKAARVHYACVFSQSDEEYDDLMNTIGLIGKVLEETSTGNVYQIEPMETVAGPLRIVKIRKYDPTRQELGDADFAAIGYAEFKARYLGKPGFKLIEREDFEMIEIMDPSFDARVYFSNPPVEEQFNLKR